jgi:hypothetical protein
MTMPQRAVSVPVRTTDHRSAIAFRIIPRSATSLFRDQDAGKARRASRHWDM